MWILSKLENGTEKIIGTYSPHEGKDVMGCDMHDWMVENDHYGDHSPDLYEWDGDSESVAIMAMQEGLPDFRFEWQEVAE